VHMDSIFESTSVSCAEGGIWNSTSLMGASQRVTSNLRETQL